MSNDRITVVVPDNFQFQYNSSLFEGTKYDIIPITSYVRGLWAKMQSYNCMFATVPFCTGDKIALNTNEIKKSTVYTIDDITVTRYVHLTGNTGDKLFISREIVKRSPLHVLGDISQDLYERMRKNAMVGTPEYTYFLKFDEDFHKRACEYNRDEPIDGGRALLPTMYRGVLPFEDSGNLCILNRDANKFVCGRIEGGKYYFTLKNKRYLPDISLKEDEVKELLYRYFGGLKVEKLLPEDPLQ